MKHYLLLLLASLAMLTGCEKDDDPTSVSLRSITREKFDYKGGLASAVVDAGGRNITAESSETWCRTAVIGSTVNLNVLAYTGDRERTATVTVKAEGLAPLLISVVQDKFRGLVVTPTTLIFSDTDRTLSAAVTCSGTYEVKLTENPNEAFSFSKSEDGTSISFTSNKASSRVEVKGRAELTPEEGEPVIITLIQPKKSTYDFLLGTWNVTKTDILAGSIQNLSSITFAVRENQYSFKVTINDPALKDYPFTGSLPTARWSFRPARNWAPRERSFTPSISTGRRTARATTSGRRRAWSPGQRNPSSTKARARSSSCSATTARATARWPKRSASGRTTTDIGASPDNSA